MRLFQAMGKFSFIRSFINLLILSYFANYSHTNNWVVQVFWPQDFSILYISKKHLPQGRNHGGGNGENCPSDIGGLDCLS